METKLYQFLENIFSYITIWNHLGQFFPITK